MHCCSAPATYPEVSAVSEPALSHVTRVGAPGRHASAADRAGLRISSLFGLAPCGVYPAPDVTAGAVRSYRTFSPLPTALARRGRYLLCGTSRLAALTPRSRTLSGTLPCGVRTFLSRPGLRLAGSGRPSCLHDSSYQLRSGQRWSGQLVKREARRRVAKSESTLSADTVNCVPFLSSYLQPRFDTARKIRSITGA